MTSTTSDHRSRSTLDPTAGQVWHAARGPVVVLLLVLVAGVVLATLGGGGPRGYLDPRAADPSGSRAVASLLRDQGITVDLVRSTAAMRATTHAGDTLLVTSPDQLVASQAQAVRDSGADLVLADSLAPERFVPGVTLRGGSGGHVRAPGCALPAATRAGNVNADGLVYSVDATKAGVPAGSQIEQCYSNDGDPSLVHVLDVGGRNVTLLGIAGVLTNEHLDEQGNAALALSLLGAHDRLVWYLPRPGDLPTSEQRSLYDLVPDAVWWALVQAVVAVVLLGLWRARRLGAIVPEPLPVVVRSTETVEGRGRLYRRSGARDKAAAALRSASLRRLTPVLGLPRASTPSTVADAIAARTGLTTVEVSTLLYGAAPTDDSALVRLADHLDDLEREVRRP
jgi:Domain of unknown function (DUF4350)